MFSIAMLADGFKWSSKTPILNRVLLSTKSVSALYSESGGSFAISAWKWPISAGLVTFRCSGVLRICLLWFRFFVFS